MGNSRSTSAVERPYLTFEVGEQQYAFAVADVLEVTAMVEPIRLASAPAGVIGMVNRHGEPVILIDLRAVTGMARPELQAQPYSATSLFIVVQTAMQPDAAIQMDTSRFGVLVDKVDQVEYFADHERTALPQRNTQLIQAVVVSQNRVIQIIAPVQLISMVLGQENISDTHANYASQANAYQNGRTGLSDTAVLQSTDR